MALNFDLQCKAKDDAPNDVPPQLPVTILDMERTNGLYDMDLHMADACPRCGAFNLRVGDYVCWGHCFPCYEEAYRK